MSDEAARMIERLRDVDEDALYDAPWTAEQLCKQAAALIASQQAEIARLRDEVDRDDLTEMIECAIDDSLDMDWTSTLGARAIIGAFDHNGWTVVRKLGSVS